MKRLLKGGVVVDPLQGLNGPADVLLDDGRVARVGRYLPSAGVDTIVVPPGVVICPGFVRTPLVDKQIPEQARELGITEEEVVGNVMLKDTVDGEFTTLDDVAQATLFFAAFPTNALTGQSLIVSHGWCME